MKRPRHRRSGPAPGVRPKSSKVEDRRYAAQELAYRAMDAFGAGTFEEAYQLCLEAIGLWPACLDAHLMLFQMVEVPNRDRIEMLRELVGLGMTDLGEKFVVEHMGMLWMQIEARPVLRAFLLLATSLSESRAKGALDEAIHTAETMLTLDEEDHLGVRGPVAAWYIARKRWQELRELLELFEGSHTLELTWAAVALAFATEGEAAAARALPEALLANPFALDYLTGRRRRRGPLPPIIEWRGDTEAILAAHHLRPALRAMPEFKTWLQSQKPGAVPPA